MFCKKGESRMSKAMKIWLVIAASLVLIGALVFGGVMAMLKWDFTKLSTNKYVTNEYEINESFSAISIDVDTTDVKFVPSEDSSCSVSCYEQTNMKHSVTVKDGTLTIKVVDTRKWYEHIGIGFNSPSITVYIPKGKYGQLLLKSDTGDVEIPKEFKFEKIDISTDTGDVKNYASASGSIKIKTDTGDVCVENISAAEFDVSVSTGDIVASHVKCDGEIKIAVSTGKTTLTDVICENLSSRGSTGNMILKNVIVGEVLSVERSTGDVRLDRCDAAQLFIMTDTGDIKGSLLSEKVFVYNTDTGDVDLPHTTTGGICEIYTGTGDIKITIN